MNYLALGAVGAGLYWYFARPSAPPSSIASPPVITAKVTAGGHDWIVRDVPTASGSANGSTTDIYAPAGSWGPHAELRVLRFTRAATPNAPKVLAGVGADVPVTMRDAAIAAFAITVPLAP